MRNVTNHTSFAFLATLVLAMIIAFMFLNSHFFEIGSKRYTDLGNGWHLINVGRFEIETPTDFKYIEAEGIDSFVGYFTNSQDTIEFDYGLYSNDLKDPIWQRERTTINGIVAIIASSEENEMGVHFFNLKRSGDKLTLYGRSENEALIKKIYKTVKFPK